MKILCITYCYPPLQYPATMCYVKLVAGLKALGVEVEVVTVDPGTFYFPGGKFIDSSMLEITPEGVKNHAIRSWESHSLMSTLRENHFTHSLFYRLFEPRKREWTYPALKYLKKVDMSGYDAILSCSQPHCNHLIGLELQRLTGKPWIAYLSDPWVDMPWGEYPSKKIADYNLTLEKKVITSANAVLFTSQETVDLVMRKYPTALRKKCGVLPHAYVPEWFSHVKVSEQNKDDDRIKILHTGHFYGERTPMPVFRALEKLHGESVIAGRVHFSFLGGMSDIHRQFVFEKGLDSFISVESTVPYLQSLALMKQSDYLLLVEAPLRNRSESVFLPSKLVDYLGSGKPVIGITPARGASARVLKETGNIVCDVNNEEDVYQVFADLLDGNLSFDQEPEQIKKYHYYETSKQLDELMSQLIG